MNENGSAENALRHEQNYNFWSSVLDNQKPTNLQPRKGVIWSNVLLPQQLTEEST